jgi:hypothetical protein
MQDSSVESRTSEISSSSTLWQDLEVRYKLSNEVNMTPRSPGTNPKKMKNSEDPTTKLPNLAGQGASSNPRRNWRQGPTCRSGKTVEDSGTNTQQMRPSAGWNGPRPAGLAHFQAQSTPFDLAAIRTIYSPEARSHASIHSSSASKEQRREGHHLGEARVDLLD